MDKDLQNILDDWDYDPSSISARWIKGRGGEAKVQLRLDLGLLQMEVEGRPDGMRPHNAESLLHYYRGLEKAATSKVTPFSLGPAECAELQQEAVQYYYRYLSFYALHHLEGVITDTQHNLDLFELVARNSSEDEVAWQFLQFYPYVRMMNSRAQAEKFLDDSEFDEAIEAAEDGLVDIEAFWDEYEIEDEESGGQEIESLKNLLRYIRKKKPKTAEDKLREELEEAIAEENYEKAAILRDALMDVDRGPGGMPGPSLST